jgi:hypothetical protein
VILTGDVPSPANPPSGCRFHTRCWLYERLGRPEQCRTEDPPLRGIGDDHQAACHFAEEAQQSDVGVAHFEPSERHGTPATVAERSRAAGAVASVAPPAPAPQAPSPNPGAGES